MTNVGVRGAFPVDLWARLGEEFLCLRTRLLTDFRDEKHRTVLVTSSVKQEGKTTVSANLSRSFALGGFRTLLVDADLRRPDLHRLFAVSRIGGLSDVVGGRLGLEAGLVRTDLPELDLLTAGSPVDSPVELIGSPAFPALLRELAARYDYVVVDTPPLISIADTSLLARYADGIVLVVAARATPREIVLAAVEQLHDRPLLGTVLNGFGTPAGYDYYGRG